MYIVPMMDEYVKYINLHTILFGTINEINTGVLSTCWKDKATMTMMDQQTEALRLIKVLVEKQNDVFAAIGVQFPTWDNRPLTVKDLVHCLNQYSKYVQLQQDMRKK